MNKVKSKRGRLGRALIVMFIISIFLSVMGIIVIGTTDDLSDVHRENEINNSYYNNNASANYGGSSSSSYGNSGSASSSSSSNNSVYLISTTTNLANAGSYTQLSSAPKRAGDSVTLRAIVNDGYTFVGWYDGETQVSANALYTFSMPAKNVTYTAKFEKKTYMLTTSTNLEGAGSYTEYNSTSKTFGDSVSLVANANEGYTFVGWYDGETRVSPDASYTFTMPTKNTTYQARYYKLRYSLSADESSYEVTGHQGYVAGNVEVLSSYKGKAVTSIGDFAFANCDNITTVVIPNGVISIGHQAFYYCSGLTSIVIPNGVTNIGGMAFKQCDSLTSVSLPNSITNIGYQAFTQCDSLTSVSLPNSITTIGEYMFAHCKSLTSVTIPNNVTSIGSLAFVECSSLASVIIPNGVQVIGDGAFRGCTSLTSVSVSNHVSIGTGVFENCSGLTSVTILDNVTRIKVATFRGCTSLTSITIPKSVVSIEDSVFQNCTCLTLINYEGTIAEWRAISKGADWNSNLGNGDYTVHCTDGDA